jgi:hypothetical protein
MTTRIQRQGQSPGRAWRRLPRLGYAALLLVTAGTLVAACGGDPSPSHSGSGGGSSSSNQSGIKFAACMRSHGVPSFPDNAITISNGKVTMDVPSSLDPNSPQFQSAEQACRQDLPGGGSGSSSNSNTQQVIKFANCMRSHGVTKFPEPNSQGRELITSGSGIDPNSPQYQSAMQACRHLLPNGGSGATAGG